MSYTLHRQEVERVRELLDQLRRREGFGDDEREELRSILSRRDPRVRSLRLRGMVRYARKLLEQREAV